MKLRIWDRDIYGEEKLAAFFKWTGVFNVRGGEVSRYYDVCECACVYRVAFDSTTWTGRTR